MNWKRSFSVIGMVLVLLCSCQESLEKRAERTLRDYSEKNCPQQMDTNIVLDSCAFDVATHTLCYYYRLTGILDNDSTLNKESMRQLLVSALRNETSTRIYKEAGYSFKYTYFSQKQPGKVLFETVMTQEDYQ
jgi:hypothetical protein